jgi:hypothetical protein
VKRARDGQGAGGEGAERAEAYLKLAQSLARARQHGKAARHAQRTVELAEAAAKGPVGGDEDAGGPPVAPGEGAESAVRAEIAAIRAQVERREVELDPQAFELVRAAEEFERSAAWAQALEVLAALREKIARAHEASVGPGSGGDPPAPPPPPSA